jgi:hypothetical protein
MNAENPNNNFNSDSNRLIGQTPPNPNHNHIPERDIKTPNCKKIRDDKGYWYQIESYITKHYEVGFGHSICPECEKKFYPEFCEDD